MEKFACVRSSRKYGFHKGEEYTVIRTITGNCVVIVKDEKLPNTVLTEEQLRFYGKLTGEPVMG